MPRPPRACCLISEVLEEAGLDRARARQLRRQLLHGIILLCQWQLERLDASAAGPAPSARAGKSRARKVTVD
jgi:hypothetical protein